MVGTRVRPVLNLSPTNALVLVNRPRVVENRGAVAGPTPVGEMVARGGACV